MSETPAPPLPHLTGDPAPGGSFDFGDNSSGTRGPVPPEVARHWNWGAFVLSWLWLMNHGMKGWGLLVLLLPLPVAFLYGFLSYFAGWTDPTGWAFLGINGFFLGVNVFLGVKGNALAWRHRRFASAADFHRCQRTWAYWCAGLTAASLAVTFLGFV